MDDDAATTVRKAPMFRLVNVNGRAALERDGQWYDLAELSGDATLADPLAAVARHRELPALEERCGSAPATGLIAETVLGAPVPQPRQVFGIGLNYRQHAEETGATLPPIPATFTKFPTCLTGPEATVALPSGNVDWEVELVVVMGRTAHRVPEADAWAHVAGLTIGIVGLVWGSLGLSERVVQRAAGSQFSLGKSYPGFGPTGPWLVTPDELADPDDLGLGCSIGDEVLQDARTDDLVFSVSSLIAQLSAVVTLLPGDVIFTGTPSGVGTARKPPRYLEPGQVLTSWIEGIGTMHTTLVASA